VLGGHLIPLADVITPFMGLVGLQLVFVNLVVALIESLVLRRFFKKSRRALFGWMVLANYVSAIFGAFLLTIVAGILTGIFAPLVLHLQLFLWLMFLLALLLSFIIEFPFVCRAAGKDLADRRRAFAACAASQAASYILLLPFYWIFIVADAGHFNAGVQTTASLDFVRVKSATIMYLSGRNLMRVRLDGSAPERVADAPTANWHDDLSVWRNQTSGKLDLWLTDAWNDPQNVGYESQTGTLLLPGVTSRYPDADVRKRFDLAADWRGDGKRLWTVEAMSQAFAPHFGLHVRNDATGEDYHLTVNTAFVLWLSRCPTVLPGDQVVFELGRQIMVLDLQARRMGLVTEGHSPIVTSLGESEIKSAQPTS